MKEMIRRFLNALDETLVPFAAPGEVLDLYHLGRSVLIYHLGIPLSTRDFDIVLAHDHALQAKALELFGKGTGAASEFGLYLEAVPDGLPPLAGGFKKRCEAVAGGWKVLRLWRMDWHDFAASKMRRFSASDRADLTILCDRRMLDRTRLRETLEKAFIWTHEKDGDELKSIWPAGAIPYEAEVCDETAF
jgi:hypothetical protein